MSYFNDVNVAHAARNELQSLDEKHTILIVDDNELELLVFRSAISEEVVTSFVSSAEEAIRYIEHHSAPDLIILDVMMPTVTGFQLCEQLKADFKTRDIPIIFLTALNNLDTRTKAFKAGAVDFISKPFYPEELEFRVMNQLRAIDQRNHLESLAFVDELTRLPNRRRYNQAMLSEWSRCKRHKTSIALLIIDIDSFKLYNDTYGHMAGDRAISEIGQSLSTQASRPGDICARFGGEEFVLLLPECNVEGAIAKASKALKDVIALSIPHERSSAHQYASISVGVAVAYPSNELDTLELFKRADTALYEAKTNGKNQFVMAPTYGEPHVVSKSA